MEKIWELIIDIFIAILIMFLGVMIYFGLRTETVVRTIDKEISQEFLSGAKRNGYITTMDYEKFIDRLSVTQVLYDISLEHRYKIAEPEYRMRTIEEIIEAQNAAYIGENIYHAKDVHTDIPIVTDPIDNSGLVMNTETNESILAKAVVKPGTGHVHTDSCHQKYQVRANWEATYIAGDRVYGSTAYIYCDHCGKEIANVYFGTGTPTQTFICLHAYFKRLDGSGNVYNDYKGFSREYRYYTGDYEYEQDYARTEGYLQNLSWWYHEICRINGQWAPNTPTTYPYDNYTYIGFNTYGTYDILYIPYEGCPYCKKNPACGKKVVSISPTHPVQAVYTGEKLITTAIATYQNGDKKTVLCTSDYNTTQLVKNADVILSYTDELGNALSAKLKVTVVPRTKTCKHGHVYNLSPDGSDLGCPYCRQYVESIRVAKPTTSTMTITIGTTLQSNGLELLVTYMDGRKETITDGYTDNLDSLYYGTKLVTIGYKGVLTQLMVTTLCKKMTCDICGFVYDLYPDGTNPGCPRCISKTPVFTGNVLEYEIASYTDEVLEDLYGDGIYHFRKDDTFTLRIENKSSTMARNIMKMIYRSMPKQWLIIQDSEEIKSK